MGQLAQAISADFVYLFRSRHFKVVVFSQSEWLIWARRELWIVHSFCLLASFPSELWGTQLVTCQLHPNQMNIVYKSRNIECGCRQFC